MKPSVIRYAIVPCTLGRLLVAVKPAGICMVALDDNDAQLRQALQREFPRTNLVEDRSGLKSWTNSVLQSLEGKRPAREVAVDVEATQFQKTVWRRLRQIPAGQTASYKDIAVAIGQPKASRAVARACATNPVAVIVPCHRVVRTDGGISGYRWGVARKRAILAKERNRHS